MYSIGSTALPGFAYADEPGDCHDSPEAFAFIQRCRNLCKTTHSICHGTSDARVLPPRLIRVEEHRLVLVDSVTLPWNSRYLALSYCWGKDRSLCTTSETMATFREGIAFEEIPPVLLDAAEVTRKLGEKYIWIDRLCILQDDPLDWQQNASIMASVYEQAEFTVAAVASASVKESFLRPLNGKRQTEGVSLVVPWPDECRERFGDIRARVRPKGPDVSYNDDMEPYYDIENDSYPLDSRGWTYQERYLSRRSVRYLPHQIVWECHTAQFQERYPFDTLMPATLDEWQQSVQIFTMRSLTFATDRTAAISGVASRWPSGGYAAGLWNDGNLLSQLRWSPNHQPGTKFSDHHSLGGAPSWSWLSLTQPIVWNLNSPDLDADFRLTNRWEPNIVLVDLDVVPSGPDRFGAVVLPGKLVLYARLLDATLCCQQQNQISPSPPKYKCTILHSGQAQYISGVAVDTHLELVTTDNESRWTRQSTRHKQHLRPGTDAAIKLFPMESDSFAMLLSPLHGNRHASMPMYERIGHISIDLYARGGQAGVYPSDNCMQEALYQARYLEFCIV